MVKQLEKNFTGTGEVKGFEFHQIKRGKNALMYEVYSANFKHFEVFTIKHTPICLDFKNRIYSETDFKEVYPKSKDFGTYAWTCKSIDCALKRFNSLEYPKDNPIA